MDIMHKSFKIVFIGCLLALTTYHFLTTRLWYFNQYSCIRNSDRNSEVTDQLKVTYRLQPTTQKRNKGTDKVTYPTTVPNLIIQYGSSRTASTLQFQILCMMMAFLHEDELNDVGCYFHNDTDKRYKYTVVKTHSILKLPMSIPSDSWMFVTSSDTTMFNIQLYQNYSMREMRRKNITIPYVADVKLVSKRGHFIAYEYQHFFGMSDEYMRHIIEYLRYWDILRLCCGRQMSSYWRNRLISNTTYLELQNKHSPTYPACEMYNISEVEQLVLSTFIVKKFGRIDSLRKVLGQPSILDGVLDGSFCERCNKNITEKKIPFNFRCA